MTRDHFLAGSKTDRPFCGEPALRRLQLEALESRNLLAAVPQATFPYHEDFNGAALPGESRGWEYASTSGGRIMLVSGKLQMDDAGAGGTSSRNEATLHLNLVGQHGVRLTVDHASLNDGTQTMSNFFQAPENTDGIALSDDGVSWYKLVQLNATNFTGGTFDLDAAVELLNQEFAADLHYSADFRIKFQQYGTEPATADGRTFDEVLVTVDPTSLPLTPQTVPYTQTFSAVDPPRAADGWEYYSTAGGRISVISSRLQMDQTIASLTALNEAILHVDLEGQRGVRLSVSHTSLSDFTQNMSDTFQGHEASDGIAISDDGVTWFRLLQLNATNFTGGVFDLDAAIELLNSQLAAGLQYTADFQIKFQQVGSDLTPADGRTFDNVEITVDPTIAPLTPQAVQYLQTFSTANPPRPGDGWEYYSTAGGRISVISNRLQMDQSIGGLTALNEAILHVDLEGQRGVRLSVNHTSLGDSTQFMSDTFQGHESTDGIAISDDGVTWYRLLQLNATNFTGGMFDLDAALAQIRATYAVDIDYTADFQIKFQQVGSDLSPADGRTIDSVEISVDPTSAPLAPQAVPYTQSFSTADPPRPGDGWEYYSTAGGRVLVVSNRLQLDQTIGGVSASNEATLHLNLAGRTGVVLTLDHASLNDGTQFMADTFQGHEATDGIAISDDGITWYRLVQLDSQTFLAGSYDLDAAVAQIRANFAADFDYSADFRIRFQQTGSDLTPDDGRAFDNIEVTADAPVGSTVAGRQLFYNQSAFDGNSSAINAADDGAIAPDKTAYLPGDGLATFANVSSYSKGINGIAIDLAGGGAHSSITGNDFVFKVGANNTPGSWGAAPAPAAISVRTGAGVSGSDRVEITWANGAVKNTWLEVQVLATANTGLGAPDVFFFGNRIGDTGSPTATSFTTTTGDASTITAGGLGPAGGITNVRDIDRTNAITVAGDRSAALGNIGALNRLNVGTGGPFAPTPAGDTGIASALAMSASKIDPPRTWPLHAARALTATMPARGTVTTYAQLVAAAIVEDADEPEDVDVDDETLDDLADGIRAAWHVAEPSGGSGSRGLN
ncbi:MAG: hypothetical protein AB7O59_22250 [Pirellulales bacterium]